MAAQSRLSFRPSSRCSAGLDELTATDIQKSINTRKRTREVSTPDERKIPKKLLRNHETIPLPRYKATKKIDVAKHTAAPSTTDALTQVEVGSRNSALPHVRQQPNGPTKTSHSERLLRKPQSNNTETLEPVKKSDKRSLRSRDGGSRSKSELAMYFPYYDEFMSNEPKEPELLTEDTLVYITDEPSKSVIPITSSPNRTKQSSNNPPLTTSFYKRNFNELPQTNEAVLEIGSTFNNAEVIDFVSDERHARHITEDPLSDDFYFKAHRRAERSEKQLRNIEKERAQHEKVQLERLYDGLKGHDWLKVMGISGITESEKKSYEPKRDHFIHEVGTLLSKFKQWKEEEKRRKFERERASTTDTEEDDDGEEEAVDEGKQDNKDGTTRSRTVLGRASERESYNPNNLVRKGQSLSSRTVIGRSRRHPSFYTELLSPLMEKPFTSFYSKPYLRDAAIGKRRRGRTRFAFGQPLPEIPYRAFELPPSILSEEVLAANARRRRAAKREGKESQG
ncbi:MAG: hypothetical protein Q9167_005858 [Letrouitia subvulpina]